MPRSRGTELPLRQSPSPRVPLHLKTAVCTESNGRSMVDRSPKLHDHRSPRSSSPFNEKKRGTRVSDLETKLGKAQEELKKLREQLASAESAKKDAQIALESAKKHVGRTVIKELEPKQEEVIETEKKIEELETKEPEIEESTEEENSNSPPLNYPIDVSSEDKENINEIENEELKVEEKEEENAMKIIEQAVVIQEEEKDKPEENNLNTKLLQQEEQIHRLSNEYTEMKKKAEEAMEKANKMEEQTRVSDAAKQALEGEMRRLRIQTEQWRKAAEEAANVLARGNGDVFEGRRLSGARCGPLDGWNSPVIGEEEERRRRSGMRMFGELWKKKGQHK